MIKVSTFLATTEYGYSAVPLFGPADREFEKNASPYLLPPVLRYIEGLRPKNDSQYVLVNALAASEYFGSNINGDAFPEASLIHCPEKWTGIPLIDKGLSTDWPYGFPTFYNAGAFAHHRNKDPKRAYGEVELALWNDLMKRVELVVRVDLDKCQNFGGVPVWDKLKSGQFPDVSMGCFAAGTLVTMADGNRRAIEEVQVGERVLTHEGRPRRVLATQRRPYRGRLFRIKPEAHPALVCTEEHPLYCALSDQVRHPDQSQRRWVDPEGVVLSPEWVPAKDLADHDCVEPVLQGVLTPDYATREFCRLLGYYIAEGHLLRGKDGEPVGIQLSAHRDDVVHAEVAALCSVVGTRNPPSWFDSSSSEYSKNIYVFDAWLARKFEELAGTGAKTKRLAEEVLHWAPELQAELIGAYVNGDGCYGGRGSLNLSSANRDLMFQWLTILPRLGVAASMTGINHKVGTGFSRTNTREWVLHIGKQYVGPLVGKCAKVKDEPLLRANNMRLFFGEHLVTPVRQVEEFEGEIEVFNLEVEEDNSYQVGNLAVHNSKVPYDTSSITLDWKLYREAQATFDPKKHKHPGVAVLEFHRVLKAKNGKGIPGLSITRDDYDEWCLKHMNRILPDGRKVFVYNDYPRFFDISFVFIGADRTAKTMVFIFQPSVKVAYCTYSTEFVSEGDGIEKAASIKTWVTGAPGSGKTTYVHEQFPDDPHIHLDNYRVMGKRDPTKRKGTDWPRVNDDISAAGKPVVVEGTALRPSLMRTAERKVLVDPGRDVVIRQFVQRAKERSEDAWTDEKQRQSEQLGGSLYDKEYKTDIEPRALRLGFSSQSDELLKKAFGIKDAELKQGEIDKDVVPSQMAGKAVPVLNRGEPDVPKDLLKVLASQPEDEALSTSGALGIILRPREYQRITLIRMGQEPLANSLDESGITFPKVDEVDSSTKLSPEKFSPALAKLLEPLMDMRSLLGPSIEQRVVMISMPPKGGEKTASSHSSELLRKIGAAYNGYRSQLMEYVANTQECAKKLASTSEGFCKLAEADPEEVFTPLSYCYLRDAFLDELGVPMSGTGVVETN